jgi:hypothetical protein
MTEPLDLKGEGRRLAKPLGPDDLGLQILTRPFRQKGWTAEVKLPDGRLVSAQADSESAAVASLMRLLGGTFVPWVGEDA